MLELKNVFFTYGDRPILENFSFRVENSEAVCLTGESGCGKTTVLRLLEGLEKPLSGNITVTGKPAVVFQEDRLLPWISVRKNVCLNLAKERRSIADELLLEAGFKTTAEYLPEKLSGGMKRRAAIVRALAFGGDSLILDEPFNGIDFDNKRIISDMIKREYILMNKPVLMVSHNRDDAALLNAKEVSFASAQGK